METLHIELAASEATFLLLYDEVIKRQRRLPPEQREQLEVIGRQLLEALGEDDGPQPAQEPPQTAPRTARLEAVARAAAAAWAESSANGGLRHNDDVVDELARRLNQLDDSATRPAPPVLTVHSVGTQAVDGESLECVVLTGDQDSLRSVAEHLYEDVEVFRG